MSFDALAWAAKQRPGNLAAKMVLFGLANFADEHGCCYPSTAALAAFGDMDHKTATAALDRLAKLGLIKDTGEREGRTRQIKVYRLALESTPKAEGYQKRKPSAFSSKDPQKRGTDTVRDTSTQKASPSSSAPKRKSAEKADRGSRIANDWQPPSIDSLEPQARAAAEQWPDGAYAAFAEEFRLYWQGQPGSRAKKLDWRGTWCGRIIDVHAKAMRWVAPERRAWRDRPSGWTHEAGYRKRSPAIDLDADEAPAELRQRADQAERRAEMAESVGRFDDASRADARTLRARAAAIEAQRRDAA
jgi:DNA-binding transcriptional ArsR family regulator